MRVIIPSQLRSYTRGASEVGMAGATLAEALSNLETAFPGIRFRIIDELDRIRPHIRIFVAHELVRTLDIPLRPGDEIQIVGALSGG
ncbi:MAG TPA: MoaD/ThiS family protein [Candidatus Binataceae bacterium]|nr:MoaD/ThiS family protein [Candidatus Binataceae bacterium]